MVPPRLFLLLANYNGFCLRKENKRPTKYDESKLILEPENCKPCAERDVNHTKWTRRCVCFQKSVELVSNIVTFYFLIELREYNSFKLVATATLNWWNTTRVQQHDNIPLLVVNLNTITGFISSFGSILPIITSNLQSTLITMGGDGTLFSTSLTNFSDVN